MKKILLTLLSLLICISICSCAKEEGIELNLENYEDYLIVEQQHYVGGEEEFTGGNWSDIVSEISVEGVSTNYIYKDVEIDFVLHGAYYVDDDGPDADWLGFTDKIISKVITVECNVAGNGEIINYEPTGGYVNSKMIEYLSCEISSVRGKVVES